MRQLIIILTILTNGSLLFHYEKPFVGMISYQLEYSNVDERLSNNYLCSSGGDSVAYYHSNEGYLEKFYCSNEIIQTRWFDSKDNSLYMQNESHDTVYHYFANETDYEGTIEKTETIETIIGYECRKFTIALVPKDGKDVPKVKYDYYVTTDVKIDPTPYKNFVEGGYSELISESSGLILKQTYYGPYYNRTRTAVSLEWKDIEIDKHKPNRKLVKKKI